MAFRSIPSRVSFSRLAGGLGYTSECPPSGTESLVATLYKLAAAWPVPQMNGAKTPCIPSNLYKSYWKMGDAAPFYVDDQGTQVFPSTLAQRDFDAVCACVNEPVPGKARYAQSPGYYSGLSAGAKGSFCGSSTSDDYFKIAGVAGSQKRIDYCWSLFYRGGWTPPRAYSEVQKRDLAPALPASDLVTIGDTWLRGMPPPCGHIVGTCYDHSKYESDIFVAKDQQRLRFVEREPKNPSYFPVDSSGLPDPAVSALNVLQDGLIPGRDASAVTMTYDGTKNPVLMSIYNQRVAVRATAPISGVGGAVSDAPMDKRYLIAGVAAAVAVAGAAVFFLTRKK